MTVFAWMRDDLRSTRAAEPAPALVALRASTGLGGRGTPWPAHECERLGRGAGMVAGDVPDRSRLLLDSGLPAGHRRARCGCSVSDRHGGPRGAHPLRSPAGL